MVRLATKEDIERVNELRKQVNDVHVNGRPDMFQPGFGEEMQNFAYEMLESEERDILVAIRDEVICGFACVGYVERPVSPYMLGRRFYHVDEFGVDEAFRRQGVATELFEFMKKEAKEKGFERIELDVWGFNEDAIKFYESVGFLTLRKYLEFTKL